MKKAGVVETLVGPYDLRHVAFYQPEDVIVSPLRLVFGLPSADSGKRHMDVMDAASQTLVTSMQESRGARREAAQWLLDIAGARYGCDVCELEKWI